MIRADDLIQTRRQQLALIPAYTLNMAHTLTPRFNRKQ
jgi:hypothetical protein